jgi:hypothetical protein
MRRFITTLLLAISVVSGMAQTLNVQQGNVTYAFTANSDDMTYSNNGQTLTIGQKAFNVSDISQITVDDTKVEANTVSISYNGTAATVTIAGNVAPYVTATVSGAHVTISQSNTADVDGDEITYQLNGTSSNGSLTLGGSYKCTISLAGVTLTNPSGPAINITNKKRIQISAKNGTENTLTDGADANESWKGCLYSKGQLQLQGKGTLTVKGQTAHAIKSGDYITVKNLTLIIPKAVKDGINCNKYFQMKSGNVSISGVGDDGIEVEPEEDDAITSETENHEDENSGNLYIEGGTLTVTTTGTDVKCIKSDYVLNISGGTINATAQGSESKAIKAGHKVAQNSSRNEAPWNPGGPGQPGGHDTTKYDYYGSLVISDGTIIAKSAKHEAIESKSTIVISGGIVYAEASDDAINAGSDFTITGGYVMGNSTGNDGLDANGNFYIKGGNVFAIGTQQPEVGVDANTEGGYKLYITGGNVVAIGGLENGSSLTGVTSKSVSYSKGSWYTLKSGSTSQFSFKVPSNSRMGNSMTIVAPSSPSISSGSMSGTSIWNGYGIQ